MEDIIVNVVDGTSLPTITLGDAPTNVTSTDTSFDITVQNSESSQTGEIDVHYRVSDSGSHTGFLTISPLMDMITIPDTRSKTITVTINRDGTVGGDGANYC